MKDFLKNVFATIVGLFLYSFVIGFFFIGVFGVIMTLTTSSTPTSVNSNSILHLNFKSAIVDYVDTKNIDYMSLLDPDMPQPTGLNDILKAITFATIDDNIKGIFIENDDINANGLATIEEIRNALLDFKVTGKFIYAYANDMSQSSYYLSSVADKIIINPTGSLIFKGLCSEVLFFKDALDKLGIEAKIYRHGKFKSAVEPYMLNKMSNENRLQYKAMITPIWNKITADIAQSRGVSTQALNQIADNFLAYNPYAAAKLNLIDEVKYRDDVLDELAQNLGFNSTDKLEFISVNNYASTLPTNTAPSQIAIVYASGEIVRNNSSNYYETQISAKTFVETFKTIRTDTTIKAVVLRINSPGGEVLASDVISREVSLTAQQKPVVVSMGDYAASGGYYIACGATKIIANESTITGSIGVFGLSFDMQELANKKLGIYSDVVKTNELADFGSFINETSTKEKRVMQASVDNMYATFINRVSYGRNLPQAYVDSIGEGRVWSGIDAYRLNLTDDFGGLTIAIDKAAELANITSYSIDEYPKNDDSFITLLYSLTQSAYQNQAKKELGKFYTSAQYLNSLLKTNGIQAKMENFIEIK